ncbi:alpha/beta hydrolase [Leeuwenhoekiella marinoflava]|uniref:alpha/beta fold hydrolase n=1 Tax=Leeuwenhoekiella marinoflava TaxID=988 RepID=UPI0030010744
MKHVLLVCGLFLGLSISAQNTIKPIEVEVYGKGDPVLLIPGFTVPGSGWNEVIAYLEPHFECHVVTLAGFGGLPALEFPWLPKVNEALQEYIQINNLNNLSLIGHSLGGTLALDLAARMPDLISQLIIVDALPATGALYFPNFDPDALGYDSPYNNQQLALNATAFEAMAAQMAQGMSLKPEAQQRIKNWIVEADRKTYVYGYTDYLKFDVRESLKTIRTPVTILAADKPYGEAGVRQTYTTQYANLADYELVIATDAAHFVMYDQPEWFKIQLQRLLDF